MYKNEYTINVNAPLVNSFLRTVYGIKKMNNKRGIEFRRVLHLPDSPYLSNDETSEEYLENEGDVQGYDYRYSPGYFEYSNSNEIDVNSLSRSTVHSNSYLSQSGTSDSYYK